MIEDTIDKLDLEPGKYVVAVSGGVDSIVLLSLLSEKPDLNIIVAHFDHGIRSDSSDDRIFVEGIAAKSNLTFIYKEGNLGPDTSENKARKYRYGFLFNVVNDVGAKGLVTAHHQDDVIETALINLIRGTNRKGLSSLRSSGKLYRPLLKVPKSTLVSYARENGLKWREDPTNSDTTYLRNYIRHKIIPKLDKSKRQEFIKMLARSSQLNEDLDDLINRVMGEELKSDSIDRNWFISLPHNVAREVMVNWLRAHNISDFDKKVIEKLVVGAKTFKNGKKINVVGEHIVLIEKEHLALSTIDR
jgi:tRNA(Ile)-lysidine synthase